MDGFKLRWVCVGLLALSAGGCADDEAGGAFGRGGNTNNAGTSGTMGGFGNQGQVGDGDGVSDGDSDEFSLPPEVEDTLELQLPQASERFVFSANPDAGTVAAINAETLHIVTIETGAKPTFLRTLAGTDDAIVLNVGSDEATVIRMKDAGPAISNLPVVGGANAIAVAPDGKHAVVHFDASKSRDPSSFGDFQTVSVLRLGEGQDVVTPMTVGFKPGRVFFRDDSSQAYVVTESGVSTLDFAAIDSKGSAIAPKHPFTETAPEGQYADVSITPDGRYALSRLAGDSELRLLDLQDGTTRTLDLALAYDAEDDALDEDAGMPAPPVDVEVTDLDMAPDGSYALAVLRNQSAVLRVPLPGGFDDMGAVDTWTVEGEFIGLAEPVPGGNLVLAYTSALPEVKRMTVLDLETGATRTIDLRKSVEAVATSPDGHTALIIHRKAAGDPGEAGLSVEDQLDRLFGYSLLRPATGDTNLVQTDAPPVAFTIVPDSSHLFVLVRNDNTGVREVHRANLGSLVVSRPIKLDSPPVAVGAVEKQRKVFVSQVHPEGRMTFVDWITAERQTVTGFELNAKVRD